MSSLVLLNFLKACRVFSRPEPETHEMEAGSFPGPGQSDQHKVSPSRCWDTWVQCGPDTHGKDRKSNQWVDRVMKVC